MYRIIIVKKAEDDLSWFRKRELIEHPRTGTGKPERLKYFENEVYSRHVNHKDRMIYTIYEELKEIDITSFRGHYD